MADIVKVTEINLWEVGIGILVIIVALISIVTILKRFANIAKAPFQWIVSRKKDHELLITTAKNLSRLQEKQANDTESSIQHDKAIKKDLERLTQMFIDKEIDDQRWEILDFASALSSGRRYSKEQFDHVFAIYTKYEKILESNNLNNGQVTASMEVINDLYKEKLINGF